MPSCAWDVRPLRAYLLDRSFCARKSCVTHAKTLRDLTLPRKSCAPQSFRLVGKRFAYFSLNW